jgi:hypothetical protein
MADLHQPPLHVTRLGRLDRRVDETFSSRDGVRQELGRRETGEERVPDETFGGRFASLLLEVGEEPILEAVWNSGTGDDLLTDDGDHLGNVDLGAWKEMKEQGEEAA